MVCYSADGKAGFLTQDGIAKIKSGLARDIFQQDLTELYQRQTQRRDDLTKESGEALRRLVHQMQSGALENERIGQLMESLAQRLKNLSGKKQYGYLKAPLKAVVDEIVDELAEDESIAAAYNLWYELREEVLRTYKDDIPERLPLSRQKELKRIRNLVIEEAVRLGELRPEPSITPEGQSHSDIPKEQNAHVARAVTRLLHHMGNIFQQQMPQLAAHGMQVDSKLLRRLREKKMAHGHKADDHAPKILI